MNALQQPSNIFLQKFNDEYNENYSQSNHLEHMKYSQGDHNLQNMKKSSKSISKYLQSSSMLYSPNKRFIDETFKNNINTLNSNSRHYEHQMPNNRALRPNNQLIQDNNYDKDQTKSKTNYEGINKLARPQHSPNNLGRVVSRLQTRLQGAEVKIASLTNVVKLLQKYSQTKDDQYQKQKENMLFAKNVGERVQQIQSLEIENKIKQFNAVSKQMKKQIQEVTQLKHKLQGNLTASIGSHVPLSNGGQIKKYTSNKSKKSDFKSPTSQGSFIDLQDLAAAFQDLQQRLRDEINKKMQICLRQIKKISSNTGSNDVSGVDQNLFEEQINSLNFAINKVQNQVNRNKMLFENQIQEIVSKLPTIYHSGSLDYLPRKYSNMVDPVKNSQRAVRDKSKSRNKSGSRIKSTEKQVAREKSKSNLKNSQIQNKIQQKKRQKQEELRQAIRRKKQTKQRLKVNSNKN